MRPGQAHLVLPGRHVLPLGKLVFCCLLSLLIRLPRPAPAGLGSPSLTDFVEGSDPDDELFVNEVFAGGEVGLLVLPGFGEQGLSRFAPCCSAVSRPRHCADRRSPRPARRSTGIPFPQTIARWMRLSPRRAGGPAWLPIRPGETSGPGGAAVRRPRHNGDALTGEGEEKLSSSVLPPLVSHRIVGVEWASAG
jgi:hypothetical protein